MSVTFNQFSTDTEKPISAGFYRLEAGKELVYPYTYNEMKIILEGFLVPNDPLILQGEFSITDETGYSVTAKPGDVFYFEKGGYSLASFVDALQVVLLHLLHQIMDWRSIVVNELQMAPKLSEFG